MLGSMDEKKCRQIIVWNRFLGIVIGLALIVYGANRFLTLQLESQNTLRVKWLPSGDIVFVVMSDGPFIATHLVARGSDGDKVVARLPEAIAIVDSAGAKLDKAAANALVWKDVHGVNRKPSMPLETFQVLYYQPLKSRLRPSDP